MSSDAVSLASLDIAGEAYPRAAALARVDALEQEAIYVDGVDLYIRLPDGTLKYGYESWVCEDREGDYVSENLIWGSKDARVYISEFQFDGEGEPLFHLLTRTTLSETAPYDPPRRLN